MSKSESGNIETDSQGTKSVRGIKNAQNRAGVSQIKALKSTAGLTRDSKDFGSTSRHGSCSSPGVQRSPELIDDVFAENFETNQNSPKSDKKTTNDEEPNAEFQEGKPLGCPSLRKSPVGFISYWFNKLISAGYDQTSSSTFKLCEEFDELEMQFTRSRPPSLNHLLQLHPEFTKEEMKTLYRGFKQSCSTGVLTEEALQEIFGQIFQIGDSAEFSQLVFATLDHDNDGEVIFEEFIRVLSVLTRRGLEEKLEWIFKLYDIDQDGTINEQELLLVLRALYSMSSSSRNSAMTASNNPSPTGECPPTTDSLISDHLARLYTKFILGSPTKNEGYVTLSGFKEICLGDESIMKQISALTVVV
ncbi:Kv channel-interacting protein 4-like isoform X1 [Convolutriloba macropyga]|uniref:Kv channel-interacting protein 4-like isoform X1 n=1 Tax=Convolutriloba macropyga TaxID=536237 RepID=UPI003F51B588